MANLTYAKLKACYDYYNRFERNELYSELGWFDLIDNKDWENTCATRMSLALLSCNVVFRGRIAIKKGPFKGKFVEPGQVPMARLLEKHSLFGVPEKISQAEFRAGGYRKLIGKTGVVSFMHIVGYDGGHIDLVDGRSDMRNPVAEDFTCARSCHFDRTKEIWFWDIK